MSQRTEQTLCEAMELVRAAIAFYEAHAQSCGAAVVRDAFTRLADLKKTRLDRLEAIHAMVEQGVSLQDACDQAGPFEPAPQGMFRHVAAGKEPSACPADELAAVDEAAAKELELTRFFEGKHAEADADSTPQTDPAEVELLRLLVQDAKGQYMLVNDMKWYYEDPDAWTFADKKPYQTE